MIDLHWSAWSGMLAALASVSFLGRLLPQPIRTRRTGHVAGVSALAAMNAGIADGAWLAYGLSAAVPAVWLVSIPAVVTSAWTVALLRRSVRRHDLLLGAVWAGAIGAGAAAGLLTAALAATVLVCCGPAVWAAYATRSPVGLSRWTWWLAVADGSLWGLYGVAIRNGALELYGVVMLVAAALVLGRLSRVDRRSPLAVATRLGGPDRPAAAELPA